MTDDPYDWLPRTGRPIHEHPEYEARSRLPAGKFADWIEWIQRRHPAWDRSACLHANWVISDSVDPTKDDAAKQGAVLHEMYRALVAQRGGCVVVACAQPLAKSVDDEFALLAYSFVGVAMKAESA